jgi:hypothetical protein
MAGFSPGAAAVWKTAWRWAHKVGMTRAPFDLFLFQSLETFREAKRAVDAGDFNEIARIVL